MDVMNGIIAYLEDCGIVVSATVSNRSIMVKMKEAGLISVKNNIILFSFRVKTDSKPFGSRFDLNHPDSLGNLVDAIRERLS